MRKTLFLALVSLALVGVSMPAAAQERTQTPTPTETPAAENTTEETVTAIDASTRIIDYRFEGQTLVVDIESDIPRSGSAMALVSSTGTGVSQLEFKRIQLARGVNTIRLDTEAVNGQKGGVITVGNSAVTVTEDADGVNIFNERADWQGVRIAFIAGIITSLGLVGLVGYRRKTTDNLEVERVI
jgi:hypothetical protein